MSATPPVIPNIPPPTVIAASNEVSNSSATETSTIEDTSDVAQGILDKISGALPKEGVTKWALNHLTNAWSWTTELPLGVKIGGAVAGILGGSAMYLYKYHSRYIKFMATAIPIARHYKRLEKQSKADHWKGDKDAEQAEWDKAHEKYAPIVTDLIDELRGMYIKLAQVYSARGDFLPPTYLAKFKKYQMAVEPADPKEILDSVEKELGPIDSAFKSWEPTPIASASLSQVHKVTMVTGEPAVLKVQYPKAAATFDNDISTMKTITKMFSPEFNDMMKEFEVQLKAEFDFRREARALIGFKEAMAHPSVKARFSHFSLPSVHHGLSTRKVLTMECMEGQPLTHLLFGMSRADVLNLVEKVADWYAWSLFEFGTIHGDPHPGNFFVKSHDDIVILDFGQVVDIPDNVRLGIAQVYIALASGDPDQIYNAVKAQGFVMTKDVVDDTVKMAGYMFDSLTEGDVPFIQQYEEVALRNPTKNMIEGAAFIFRVSMILRGLLSVAQINDWSLAKFYEPHARRSLTIPSLPNRILASSPSKSSK